MKPDEVRDYIREMFPTQDRIELFARRHTQGWTEWGLDMLHLNKEVDELTLEGAEVSRESASGAAFHLSGHAKKRNDLHIPCTKELFLDFDTDRG